MSIGGRIRRHLKLKNKYKTNRSNETGEVGMSIGGRIRRYLKLKNKYKTNRSNETGEVGVSIGGRIWQGESLFICLIFLQKKLVFLNADFK